MTFQQFIRKSDVQQYQLWLSKGLFTGSYREGSRTYLLFQVYGFYVQTSYPTGTPEDMVFEPFNDTTFLEPYIENIDLQEIYLLISNPGK